MRLHIPVAFQRGTKTYSIINKTTEVIPELIPKLIKNSFPLFHFISGICWGNLARKQNVAPT